jgi:two-component system, OmpR family, phosphate regulon sensor histidine kinase PhoR
MYLKNTKLFHKLFLLFTGIFLLSFLISFVVIRDTIKKSSIYQGSSTLTTHINYIVSADLISNHQHLNLYAAQHAIRITFIKYDGTVFYDSESDPKSMGNHVQRDEVVAALANDYGLAIRYSKTVNKDLLYIAKLIDQHYVLRTSIEMKNINEQIAAVLIKLGLFYILLFSFIVFIIFKITKTVTTPLDKLTDYIANFSIDKPRDDLHIPANYEVGILMKTFNRMQRRIRENIDELTRLTNIRKEFVSNVSHELKTPLMSITGFIETLENGALDEPENSRHFLGIIKRNVDRLSSLVRDILDLSQIENEASKIEQLTLNQLLNTLLDNQHLHQETRLICTICDDTLLVDANREELYSAFLNYIDNALKFSPQGNIEISLEQHDNDAYFSVTDHGSGIDEQHIDRLFERFYRPDQARSRKLGGTGLGLSIVKNIIEKYGGKVGVNSDVGKGSCFYFTIPLSSV